MPPIVRGRIVALTPRISRMLAMLDPSTLPNASPALPLTTETTRDESDGDDRFADAQLAGDDGGVVEKQLAAPDQPGQSDDDEHEREPQGFGGFGGVLRSDAPPGRLDGEPQQPYVKHEHDDAVGAVDTVDRAEVQEPVRSEQKQQQRCDESERDVAPDVAARKGEGPDQGADPEDDEDVEEVRPHDVADGDIAVVRRGRQHRNDQLGHRSADSHDGESHDELGHAETLRESRRAVGQEVGAGKNQHEADQEKKNIHDNRIRLTAIKAMPVTTP